MKKNVFRSNQKNAVTVYAVSVLISAVLLVIASMMKSSTADAFKLLLYALSIAAANYTVAVNSIELLFEKRFSNELFSIIGILLMFLTGSYEQAALVSVTYCFCLLIMEYVNLQQTKQYLEYTGNALSYSVKNGDEYVNTKAEDLKVGDVVACEKGQYLCFDGVISDGAATRKVYSGIYKNDAASVTIKTVYDYEVDFQKFTTYSKSVSRLEKSCSLFEKIYPLVVFVIGVISAVFVMISNSSSSFGVSIFSGLLTSAAVMLLASGTGAVSGIYAANALLLAKYKQNGLTLRGSSRFDELSKIKNVVVNKNVVLVRGKFSVAEVFTGDDYKEMEIISICAAVQPNFDNPFARAFVQKLGASPEKPVPSKYIEHLGIEAEIAGKKVLVGSARLMNEQGIDISKLPVVTVYVAADGVAIGAVRLSDRLKGGAVSGMEMLHDSGINTVIVSSDNEQITKLVADECKANSYKALALSSDKKMLVEDLKKSGYTAYIGDDDEAIAAADMAVRIVDDGSDVYMNPEKLGLFARAIAAANKLNKTLFARFVVGVLVNVILIALLLIGIFPNDFIWLVAVVQVFMIVAPALFVLPMITDKTQKNDDKK